MKKEAVQGYTKEEAEQRVRDCRELGGIAAMIPQSDGKWTVTYSWPEDVSGVVEVDETSSSFAEPEPAAQAVPVVGPSSVERLGELSAKFESRGGAGTIGRDSTGGFSYGTYQIATKTGTMKRYLQFLDGAHPAFAQTLKAAGGAEGALAGTEAFKAAWKELAGDPAFAKSQHEFIQATHYEPFAASLQGLGLDIRTRSAALRDVAWSVAVQHGPGNNVFKNALSGRTPAQMTDRDIINAVYDERSKVDFYFKNSTAQVKQAVLSRFKRERADALAMLA